MKIRLRRAARRGTGAIARIIAGPARLPPEYADAAHLAGFEGMPGTACQVFAPPGRVLLAGAGPDPSDADARTAGARAVRDLAATPQIAIDARGLAPNLAAAVAEGAALRAWRGGDLRSRPDPDPDEPPPCLALLDLLVDDPEAVAPLWDRLAAGVAGANFARDLVVAPANLLTPRAMAASFRRLREAGVEVEVLKPALLREMGFGGLLAVGGGAANRPRLAMLRWPGSLDLPPVVFVGKGITFDTGGISIKPAAGMEDMRADMAGAAACAGALLALARRRSPAPVMAVLPLAENAVGAASYRPGDVLRLYGGRTVEVIDTDAEGRLVLADALAYAVDRLAPRAVIDIATLTGSIVTALGHQMAGLFASDRGLAAHVAAAGAAVGEPVWHMPIGAAHREDLDSDIADLRQCRAGRLLPDACHAAAFLREFVGDVPWAHLDIAGVEAKAEPDETWAAGPTGFGARLLDRLVALRFEDPDA